MVVAFRAGDLDAEKDARRIAGQLVEVADASAQETAGGLAFGRVPRSDQKILKDGVPRSTLRDRLSQVRQKLAVTGKFALDQFVQHIAEMEREFRAAERPSNKLAALIGRRIGPKRGDFTGRGDAAEQVERDAAKKFGVAAKIGRRDLSRRPMRQHQAVELGGDRLGAVKPIGSRCRAVDAERNRDQKPMEHAMHTSTGSTVRAETHRARSEQRRVLQEGSHSGRICRAGSRVTRRDKSWCVSLLPTDDMTACSANEDLARLPCRWPIRLTSRGAIKATFPAIVWPRAILENSSEFCPVASEVWRLTSATECATPRRKSHARSVNSCNVVCPVQPPPCASDSRSDFPVRLCSH